MITRLFRLLFKTIFGVIILSWVWVFAHKYIPVYITPLMVIRYFESDEKKSWRHDWTSMDGISENLQLAVICAEDQKFVNHNGFDTKAIEDAYENNKKGKKLRGASSISQQTAKNVFLWPDRSWFRKGLEVYFTFLIEVMWSKERILEVYLNSIEMGDQVYGAQAASQFWFGTTASKLTRDQASAIAAILPNPRVYKANPPSFYISKQKNWIQGQMSNYGPFELNVSE